MTGSMDHRGDDISDNSSDITELTDSVDLNQEDTPPTTTTTANPDPSIVLDTNPAPVTQPPTTTAQTTRTRAKPATNTSGPSTAAPTNSTHPRTRRSARISGLASPDADQATSTSGQGSSSTAGAVGKGKKRAQGEEIEAGPSKKQ